MKKALLIIILVFSAISVYAQDGLKGTWSQKHSFMGISGVEQCTYSDDKSGTITAKMDINVDFGMRGAKLTGVIDVTMSGKFNYNGSEITIKWDPDSFKAVETKPFESNMGSKVGEEFKNLILETIDEMKAEYKKQSGMEEKFFDVKISAKKLSYKSIVDGKTESESYTRVN